MASLSQKASGLFMISFRFGGQRFHRSLETVVEKEARQKKALVERTLRHIGEASHEGSDTSHVLPCTGYTKLAVVKDLLLRRIDDLAEGVLWIDDQKIDLLSHD